MGKEKSLSFLLLSIVVRLGDHTLTIGIRSVTFHPIHLRKRDKFVRFPMVTISVRKCYISTNPFSMPEDRNIKNGCQHTWDSPYIFWWIELYWNETIVTTFIVNMQSFVIIYGRAIIEIIMKLMKIKYGDFKHWNHKIEERENWINS